MVALATITDIEERLGRDLTVTESNRASALLDDASAVVRAYTGQQFTAGTSTARLKVRNGRVRLPQRPVTAVDAVEDVDGNEMVFTWDAGTSIDISASAVNEFEINPLRSSNKYVDVTYDHGYASIPDDVVAITSQIVARVLGRPAGVVAQDSALAFGEAALSGPITLLSGEKYILDKYRVAIGAIRVTN